MKLKKRFLAVSVLTFVGATGLTLAILNSNQDSTDVSATENVASSSAENLADNLKTSAEENKEVIRLIDQLEIDPLYTEYLEDVANGKGSDWVIIPNQYRLKTSAETDSSGESVGSSEDPINNPSKGLTDLYGDDEIEWTTPPASYSLITEGYGTPIKNQGEEGLCWAYAFSTALESNLKKTLGVSYEFSPRQLDYITASGSPYASFLSDATGSTRNIGDGGSFKLGSLVMGGSRAPTITPKFFVGMRDTDHSTFGYFRSYNEYNNAKTIKTYFSLYPTGFGLIPTGEYVTAMPASIVSGQRADYIATDVLIPDKTSSSLSRRIKNSVLRYGAAFVGTYTPDNRAGACYDAAKDLITDKGIDVCGRPNHAMAIVGWDDSYNGGRGAYIVQNSWGADLLETYNDLATRRVINESTFSAAEKAAYREAIEEYDTKEFSHLSYDVVTTGNGSGLEFGIIEKTKRNDYKKIYDAIDAVSTVAADDAVTGVIRTFTTTDASESIRAIGIGAFGLALSENTKLTAYLDRNASGSYEQVGTLTISQGDNEQKLIELPTPITVSGNFRIKLEIATASAGTPISLSGVEGALSHLITDVYTGTVDVSSPPDVPTIVPDTVPVPTANYTVIHCKQALDGTYPTSACEPETLSGEVGATVTPETKTYTGFTSPATQSRPIAEGGTTSITYQYVRNSYTLTVSKGAGIDTATSSNTYKFEQPVTLTATLSAGYRNITWSCDVAGLAICGATGPSPASFTMPAQNVTVTVSAEPIPAVNYTVIHCKQALDGTYPADACETETPSATPGTTVAPATKTYTGFTSPTTQSITIAANGSSSLTYQYTRNSYTVTIVQGAGISSSTSTGTHKFGQEVNLSATIADGYTNITWRCDYADLGICGVGGATLVSFIMPAQNLTITVSAEPIPTVNYTVKHCKQALDETYPAAACETETPSARAGASVTPATKTYAGFTSPATQTVTVAADGSTLVVYQYLRNSYTLTITKETGINAVTGNGTYKFEQTVTLTATADEGYSNIIWRCSDGGLGICSATGPNPASFTMPAGNIIVTVSATRNSTPDDPQPDDPDGPDDPGPDDPKPDNPKPDDPKPDDPGDPKPTDPKPSKPKPGGNDDGDGGGRGENNDEETDIKVPNTGFFTGDGASIRIAITLVIILTSLGAISYKLFRRSSHKIDFDKK